MSTFTSIRSLGVALTFALLANPLSASACAVCMGDPNSKAAGALNASIFLMLGMIGGVLALLCAFGVTLARRANTPMPPQFDIADDSSKDDGADND